MLQDRSSAEASPRAAASVRSKNLGGVLKQKAEEWEPHQNIGFSVLYLVKANYFCELPGSKL